MIKILKLFILIWAVCMLFRQPDYCVKGKLSIEENVYKIYEKDNSLFLKTNKEYDKIINEKIIDFKIYDIDSDENDDILVLTKNETNKYGSELVIYETEKVDEQIKTKEIFRWDFSEIKPWMIGACNLDNDGETDIFIGVHKDTVFYKDVRNRPFFYSWDGQRLNKKWLGSFFSDWELADITFGDYYNLGYDLAAVLEKNNDSYRVGYYKFIGFGFENMDTSIIYTNVRSIETVKEDGRDALIINFNGIRKNMHLTFIPGEGNSDGS